MAFYMFILVLVVFPLHEFKKKMICVLPVLRVWLMLLTTLFTNKLSPFVKVPIYTPVYISK